MLVRVYSGVPMGGIRNYTFSPRNKVVLDFGDGTGEFFQSDCS